MISRPAVPSRRRRPVRTVLALLVAVLAALPMLAAGPAAADERSTLAPDDLRSVASQAAGWLAATAVAPDGAIRTPTGELDGISTAWAVLAMKASGLDAEAENPTRWLEQNIDAVATVDGKDSAAGLALLILVARAQNLPAEAFGNEDLVSRLLATRGADGLFGGEDEVPGDPAGGVPSRQGLVLSALGSVGRTDAQAADWLEERECSDGGWEFRRTDPSSSCSATAQVTGFALQGLAAVGRRVPEDAIPALRRLQDPDGGFWSFPHNTDALATALRAPGADRGRRGPQPESLAQGHRRECRDPLRRPRPLQHRSGGFTLFPGSAPDVALTARVAIAAAGQPLPLSPTVTTDETATRAAAPTRPGLPRLGGPRLLRPAAVSA